jgi:hypothetical protein
MCWCDVRGLRSTALGSLGYELLVRAALQLESERRYVGAAAPEGGCLGWPCWAWRSSGMSGRWPRVLGGEVTREFRGRFVRQRVW